MKKVECIGFQGDVCIFEIDEFPLGARQYNNQTKDAVLAYGEATGHSHHFDDLDSVEVFSAEGMAGPLFIDVKKPATLRHGRARNYTGIEIDTDYHNVIQLNPGKKYMTGIVKETDWISKRIRQVID